MAEPITKASSEDEKLDAYAPAQAVATFEDDHAQPRKRWYQPRGIGNVFACGSALFSDGYQNGVVGSVNTLIRRIYSGTDAISASQLKSYSKTFSATGFAGTVVGMLIFGLASDRIGRKFGMILCTLIVFVFAALASGSYAGGSIPGMLSALAAYRFLGGIGIGGEYPSGSVAAGENTEDPSIPKNKQHLLFALATNSAIDWGFVISAFVPLVMVWIFGEDHLRAAWRLSLGIGCIPPLIVLFFRVSMSEPASYSKFSMKRVPLGQFPWGHIVRNYGVRWLGLAVAWFIYDWISYPFGIYSSTIVDTITNDSSALTDVFGWNVVINLFYIPGTMLGALILDWLKPKRAMIIFLFLQAIFGFFMSGFYVQLSNHIGGFAVMYGLFLSFGEAGPGNCLGLLAAKSSPTAIRGMFYGSAAAVGKVGAFVGTYTFPTIIADFPAGPDQDSGPFWIGSGLAIFSAIVVFFTVVEIPADHMAHIDAEFYSALAAKGFDVSQFGLVPGHEGAFEKALAPGSKAVDPLEGEYGTLPAEGGVPRLNHGE